MFSKVFSMIGNFISKPEESTSLIANDPLQKLISFPFKGNHIIEEIICISNRIFVIPFPTQDKIHILSTFLNTKFNLNYVIYNVSEHVYDASAFNNVVIDFNYPGYPCPPLHILFSLFKQIESWLDSSEDHVVIIHCQASKSRSALIIAGFLIYHQLGFYDSEEALNFYLNATGQKETIKMIPSQKRYLNYMGEILNGFIPSDNILFLERIIINGVPNYKKKLNSQPSDCFDNEVFRPYLQIFKDAKLIYSTNDQIQPLKIKEIDGSCSFDLKIPISGDILIRCRHYHSELLKIPVFRIFFNTSFAKNSFIRFSQSSLDLDEESQDLIPSTFFIDILFSPIKNQNQNENEKENDNHEIKNYWNLIGEVIEKKISNRLKRISPKKELKHLDLEDKSKMFFIGSPLNENDSKYKENKVTDFTNKDSSFQSKADFQKNEVKEDSINTKTFHTSVKEQEDNKEEIKKYITKKYDNVLNNEEFQDDGNEENEDVENYIANLENSIKINL